MRLAVLQAPSPAGDGASALAQIGAALKAAGAMGATALVVPEVWLPGYNFGAISVAAQRAGAWLDQAAAMCQETGCGLVLGYAEPDGDRLFNATVVFDATGAKIAHFRKLQLYGPREHSLYTPGDAYSVFDIGGVKAAILICYDIEFAPHVAALAAQGATLILVPTANMHPFTHVVRHTVPAMAANHGVSIAYANYCGTEGDLTYVGGSQITGPHGETLAMAGDGPALLIADLPPRDPARASTQNLDFRKV